MLLFSKFFTRVRDRLGGYDVDEASRRFTDERIFDWYLEFRERLNSELGLSYTKVVTQQSISSGAVRIPGGAVRIDDVWLCDAAYAHTTRLQPTTYEELVSAGYDPTGDTGTPYMYYRTPYMEEPYVAGGYPEQIRFYPTPDATIYVEVVGSGGDSPEAPSFDSNGELTTTSDYLSISEVFYLAAVEHCAYLMSESAEEIPVDHVNRRMQLAEKAFRDGQRKWVTQNGGKMVNPYVFPSSSGGVTWP